jgi:hypothetical protein
VQLHKSLYRDDVANVAEEMLDPALARKNIKARFDALARRHRQETNVGWGLADRGDRWVFHSFGNHSGVKGRGARCLEEICALADNISIELQLWTASEALYPYYESFGFVRRRQMDGGVQWFDRSAACETPE